MTIYRTCRSCAKAKGCPLKAELAAAIKGRDVRSITHHCRAYEPLLKPGEHVWARVKTEVERTDYGEIDRELVEFPAVFVQFSDTMDKAVVYISEGTESRDGAHRFKAEKRNFCKVSYAPFRNPDLLIWIGSASIVGRRDGRSLLKSCCGLPEGEPCEECAALNRKYAADEL